MATKGRVVGVISNIVTIEADGPVAQNEICYITTGGDRLMAEVIKVAGREAYVQVFESTRGMKVGAEAEFTGRPLEVTLGPGMLSKNYDGLQNDLDKMEGVFLRRGQYTDPLDRDRKWHFKPLVKPGDRVEGSAWLGEVEENHQKLKIMAPIALRGTATVKTIAAEGDYTCDETIAVLAAEDGEDIRVTMVQKWPVKTAMTNYREKPRPFKLLETGVRTIDTMNPIVEGGTGFIPGPFGTGKTVLQHAISKQAEADIVIIAACGERANEVVEVFTEFPELVDPHTGRKLMERPRGIGLYGHDAGRILPLHGVARAAHGRLHVALGTGLARDVQPHGGTSRPGRVPDGPLGHHFQFLRPRGLRLSEQRRDRLHHVYRHRVAGRR